ncbi:MAG: hypothetical protein WCK29_01340 [archaeon]
MGWQNQVKSLEENKKIEYLVSVRITGPNWIHTKEDYLNTVLNATDKEILEKAEYFEIMISGNGMKIVPYEQAKGGATKVHYLEVNYFRNVKQKSAGETK